MDTATYRVDNKIAMEADNMSKELCLPFRDCLDILMRASLAERAELKSVGPNQLQNLVRGSERARTKLALATAK